MSGAAQLDAILLGHTREILLLVDPASLTVQAANREAHARLGYAPAQLLGMPITRIETGLADASYWDEVGAGHLDPAADVESEYQCADGSVLALTRSVTPDHSSGRPWMVVCARDPRPNGGAIEQAAHDATHLRTTLEAAADGILVLDRQGHVVNLNHRMTQLWSLPGELAERGAGHEIRGFMAAMLPDPTAYRQLVDAILADAGHETRHILELSGGIMLEQRSRPQRMAGRLVGCVFTFADVTLRTRAAADLLRHRDHLQSLVNLQLADLRRAKESAEHANRSKSDFLARMSHEMRTPMHAILTFSSLGESRFSSAAPDRLRGYFERINRSGQRLLGLLDDLLDLSKAEAGLLALQIAPHDLQALITEAIDEFAPLANAKGQHLILEVRAKSAIAPVDGRRFGQVVRNLLGNAIKFTPRAGRITLKLHDAMAAFDRAGRAPTAEPALLLTIIDTGSGIAGDQLENMFKPFADSAADAAGSGLGLAICREIVSAHHGTISAGNNPDGGATFTVCLPRVAAAN